MKKLFLLLIFLVLTSAAYPKIFEIDSIEKVFHHLNDKSLVVLDIDDTLLTTTQELGSDPWKTNRIKELEKRGLSTIEANKKAIEEWFAIHLVTKVRAVEKKTAGVIERLIQKKAPLLAMTARISEMSFVSAKQLRSIGINLSLSKLGHHDLQYKVNGSLVPLFNWVSFEKGIISTSYYNKGKALFEVLKKIDYQCDNIIMIDDERENLEEIQAEAQNQKVAFIGLRLNVMDELYKEFDPKIAQVQRKDFFKIMSDQEAKQIVE